jgi:hypothetical protein
VNLNYLTRTTSRHRRSTRRIRTPSWNRTPGKFSTACGAQDPAPEGRTRRPTTLTIRSGRLTASQISIIQEHASVPRRPVGSFPQYSPLVTTSSHGPGYGRPTQGLSHQTGQFQQIPEGCRVLTFREQADACLGEIGQVARCRVSEILPVPHRARL